MKRTVILLLCMLLLASVLAGCGEKAAQPAPANETAQTADGAAQTAPANETAPSTDAPKDWNPDISFSTVDMNGKAWTDACFAGHKLTVINLWAYWCPPCVGELPDLQKLSVKYADKGVQFLGLYDPTEEEEDKAKLEELKVTYPCLRYVSAFDAKMNTGAIPVTVLIDGNGKVLGEAYVGSRSYEDWEDIIKANLQ